MRIERFEEINVWQNSKDLAVEIYKVLEHIKDFNFKNQIQRSSVSVMNNITEGFERKSNKEFKQFLYIAKGSAGEIRSMLYPAKELKYIDEKLCFSLLEEAEIISRMLANFIKRL